MVSVLYPWWRFCVGDPVLQPDWAIAVQGRWIDSPGGPSLACLLGWTVRAAAAALFKGLELMVAVQCSASLRLGLNSIR